MTADNEWLIPPLRPKDHPLLLELLGPEVFERALSRDAAYRAARQGGEPPKGPLERQGGAEGALFSSGRALSRPRGEALPP